MNEFMKRLKRYRGHLARQQLRTLRGQALAGDVLGASEGLDVPLQRSRRILR